MDEPRKYPAHRVGERGRYEPVTRETARRLWETGMETSYGRVGKRFEPPIDPAVIGSWAKKGGWKRAGDLGKMEGGAEVIEGMSLDRREMEVSQREREVEELRAKLKHRLEEVENLAMGRFLLAGRRMRGAQGGGEEEVAAAEQSMTVGEAHTLFRTSIRGRAGLMGVALDPPKRTKVEGEIQHHHVLWKMAEALKGDDEADYGEPDHGVDDEG